MHIVSANVHRWLNVNSGLYIGMESNCWLNINSWLYISMEINCWAHDIGLDMYCWLNMIINWACLNMYLWSNYNWVYTNAHLRWLLVLIIVAKSSYSQVEHFTWSNIVAESSHIAS